MLAESRGRPRWTDNSPSEVGCLTTGWVSVTGEMVFQAATTCFHVSSNEPTFWMTTFAAAVFISWGGWAWIRCRASSSLKLRLWIRRAFCRDSGE